MEKKKVCIVGGGAAGKNCWQPETAAVTLPMKSWKKAAITVNSLKFSGMFCKIFLLNRRWIFLKKSVFILFQRTDIFILPVCRPPAYRSF